MTTSAPVRKEYDIPIVEPFRPKPEPLRLPDFSPERIIVPVVPVRKPVREPVRR